MNDGRGIKKNVGGEFGVGIAWYLPPKLSQGAEGTGEGLIKGGEMGLEWSGVEWSGGEGQGLSPNPLLERWFHPRTQGNPVPIETTPTRPPNWKH